MRYAISLLKDPALAEETVHEAFLNAFAAWSSFHGKSKRSTWMWSILRNQCLQHFRKSELDYDELEPDQVASEEESPDGALIRQAEAARVERALAQLPLKQREVLELRMADLSLEEIAHLLTIPLSTVKSHVHRAKKSLLQHLSENSQEDAYERAR